MPRQIGKRAHPLGAQVLMTAYRLLGRCAIHRDEICRIPQEPAGLELLSRNSGDRLEIASGRLAQGVGDHLIAGCRPQGGGAFLRHAPEL